MNINRATLLGNLTHDPELRSLASGGSVATLRMATNEAWKDKDGRKQETTEYHTVVVYAGSGEAAAKYLAKGQTVFVEGRISTRSWEKDGQKKYRTEIVADRVQFGPKSGKDANGASRDEETDNAPVPIDRGERRAARRESALGTRA
jgi:single-strand DNA-binding protein